jgi:hypothetical protein
MSTHPFRVTADECALTLHYVDGKFGFAADLTPATARALAQDLIDKAQDCEDAQDHEVEQMT